MNEDTLTQGIAELARERIDAGDYDDPDADELATDAVIAKLLPGASPVEEVVQH